MQRAGVPTPLAFNASMIGPVIAQFGSRGAEEGVPAEDRQPRHLVGAGVLRARRRLRPRVPAHDRRARRRRLGRQRPEDLDHARPVRRLDLHAGAHRPGGEEAGRHLDAADRHDHARRRGAADRADRRRLRGQRGVVRGRARAGQNLVGEENQGWTIAKFLLGNERVGVAPVGATKRALARVKERAADALADDPLARARVAELENELLALELTALRVAAHSADGEPHPASSVLKLKGSELQQAVSELVVDLAGPGSLASGAGDDSVARRPGPRRATPTLPQPPQGLDLRRLQRGAAPDHRPHDPRPLKGSDMDFTYDDEQLALRDAVRGLVGKAYADFEHRRRTAVADDPGFDEKLWTADGRDGPARPAVRRGRRRRRCRAGRDRHRLPGARPGRRTRALPRVRRAGRRPGRRLRHRGAAGRVLGALSAGESVPAFAHDEPGRRWGPTASAVTASASGDSWTLSGVKEPVPHGARADVLVVSAALPDGGTGLFLVARRRVRTHRLRGVRRQPGRARRLRRHAGRPRSGQRGQRRHRRASRRCWTSPG